MVSPFYTRPGAPCPPGISFISRRHFSGRIRVQYHRAHREWVAFADSSARFKDVLVRGELGAVLTLLHRAPR